MRVLTLSLAALLSLLSFSAFAVQQQYMLVQCAGIEAGGVYSDPDTGISKRVQYCMQAFDKVPDNYTLISTAPSGSNENVKYLFLKNH